MRMKKNIHGTLIKNHDGSKIPLDSLVKELRTIAQDLHRLALCGAVLISVAILGGSMRK